MTKKTILLISSLVLILGLIFIFFFYINKETTALPNTSQSNNLPLENNTQQNIQKDSSSQRTLAIKENNTRTEESLISLEIENSLMDWEKNQNTQPPEVALFLTLQNNDNETFFEPWRNFLRNNSAEFILTINQNSSQELILSTFYVYEWFINLSGEYEKMTPEEKQVLSRNFQQVQLYLNKR